MSANAQRDGRPAEYRWRPLFNAAKFGWRPLLHCASKNVLPLACYNFDAHEWILVFLAEMLPIKVGNQKTLYYATSITCASALPDKTRKHENHIFTQLDCVTHTMHLCAIFLKENKKASIR